MREEIDGGSSAEFARGLAKAVGDGAWNVVKGLASALDEGQRAAELASWGYERIHIAWPEATNYKIEGWLRTGALSRGPACDGDHPPRRPRLTSRTSEPRPRPGGGEQATSRRLVP